MISSCLMLVALAAPPKPPPEPPPPTWQGTLDTVQRGVVAIRVTAVRDFDTEDAGSSVGTGFVVDAERGIILTNRHMVHSGPVRAEAVFLDHEEVDLEPIYRDPVHDFGFYRYDPKKVRFMTPVALPLAPEAAAVGLEIRVVGNDAGEKLSILDGTLARLDRNAPDYGRDTYNDFNTFYLQAASNTSGGSSGSPVVDVRGRVVALNAGGSRSAASSFYLPLGRVTEALRAVQAGAPVPRGTWLAVFEHRPYDEVRRLGLPEAAEAKVRGAFPEGTGMLVVSEIVPEGPAAGLLKTGDVLLDVAGAPITTFEPLEALLDGAVGKSLPVRVLRGAAELVLTVPVADLHPTQPSQYLEIGRSILHTVSLHQARNHAVPARGVYVAVTGYWLSGANVPEAAVITAVGDTPTPDIASFRQALERASHGERVRLRWHPIDDAGVERVAVATVDRQWWPMQTCTRDDASGRWPCVESAAPSSAPALAPQTTSALPATGRLPSRLSKSLVVVDFDIPHPTAGNDAFGFVGAGVVFDTQRGLVLVDRDTVPDTLGDMTLTFGGAVRVPGRVVYVHPGHDIAVVAYDPALIGNTPVEAVEFAWDSSVASGEAVWQVGVDSEYRVNAIDTTVRASGPLVLGTGETPRFRDTNVDGLQIRDPQQTLGGVLTDKRGRVVALWASFYDPGDDSRGFYGLPVAFLRPTVEALRRGETPTWRSPGFDLGLVDLVTARERGLSGPRAEAIRAANPRGGVFEVTRLAGGHPAAAVLDEGDLVLSAEGVPLTRMADLDSVIDRKRIALLIVRDGKELQAEVDTVPLPGTGVDRVVGFAGMTLHATHPDVAAQKGITGEGVYVAWLWYGSPAARYGIRPTRRVIEINGVKTPNLDAVLAVVSSMRDGEAVRLTLEALDGRPEVDTMKLDLQYWPTFELKRDALGVWSRRRIGG